MVLREEAGRQWKDMLAGHDPYLVSLSVLIAILGGYTGFGLAARIHDASGLTRRVLLVGAAAFLAVGIWTMHFIGMLAAPLPEDAVYLVLPTIVSFLICALVVGVSLFFVAGSRPGSLGVAVSALLLGIGISSMHYVGIHGLAGNFAIDHDWGLVALSVAIAIAAGYGGLRIFLASQTGLRLAVSALVFGLAVSGMHYTAMAGMHFVPAHMGHHAAMPGSGLEASPEILALVVACLCFMIVAGFLLFLLPEHWGQPELATGGPPLPASAGTWAAPAPQSEPPAAANPQASTNRVPVQGASATQFIDVGEIRSIRADAHYTWVHDGNRERICSWPISEAEARLDPTIFYRVHRSHIVAMPHVTLMRKEGDGAVVELDGENPHLVPVSRARIADVKVRLGLLRPAQTRQ